MSTFSLPKTNIARVMTVALLASVSMLNAGCATTDTTASSADVLDATALQSDQSIALSECQTRANGIAVNAAKSKSTAQYLTAAKALQQCINLQPITNAATLDVMSRGDKQGMMKMYANTTLNFIKAGELTLAQKTVKRFVNDFPNQDIYFADYTSFIDTTTAIFEADSLSNDALSSLNINPILKSELERNRYWRSH